MNNDVHTGGCLCGAVRYSATGQPVRAVACHCKFCQRRTGSAFIVSAWFDESNTRIEGAENLKTYEHRSDETGRWIRLQFCANCGTIITHTAEFLPGLRSFSGGSFDDPNWVEIKRHTWLRSARKDMAIPEGVEKSAMGAPVIHKK